jgi:hypothetical protein
MVKNLLIVLFKILDIIAYVLPIYTSFYWLQIDEMNDKIIQLLSFSCLFLDIKFLLFYRALEYFGMYFAIMIHVAKKIISFLILLLIVVISFAHAYYILLLPRSDFSFGQRTINNDPNNPWNLASTYNLIYENGTVDSNPFLIQPPNENTNMFIDFKTSLFATYKFLTGIFKFNFKQFYRFYNLKYLFNLFNFIGDSGALTNWSYLNNPPHVILIVLFSLLVVVYLMNLFIGLLGDEIQANNNRAAYFMQKAQVI